MSSRRAAPFPPWCAAAPRARGRRGRRRWSRASWSEAGRRFLSAPRRVEHPARAQAAHLDAPERGGEGPARDHGLDAATKALGRGLGAHPGPPAPQEGAAPPRAARRRRGRRLTRLVVLRRRTLDRGGDGRDPRGGVRHRGHDGQARGGGRARGHVPRGARTATVGAASPASTPRGMAGVGLSPIAKRSSRR